MVSSIKNKYNIGMINKEIQRMVMKDEPVSSTNRQSMLNVSPKAAAGSQTTNILGDSSRFRT